MDEEARMELKAGERADQMMKTLARAFPSWTASDRDLLHHCFAIMWHEGRRETLLWVKDPKRYANG